MAARRRGRRRRRARPVVRRGRRRPPRATTRSRSPATPVSCRCSPPRSNGPAGRRPTRSPRAGTATGVQDFESGIAELDIEAAAALLEHVDDLAELGVEMLVPAQLARRSPSVGATATPADSTPSGRLGRDALVSWNVEVDGTAVDDELVRRALDAGSSLVQVGGRWVRLDAAAARRALAAVDEHRVLHAQMSTIELLRLAAELEGDAAAAHEASGSTLLDTPPPVRADAWLGQLLGGLPDDALEEGVVPGRVHGHPAAVSTARPRLAPVPRARRSRRMPGRRHGARQDPADARPPRRAGGPAPRRVPAVGGPQLAAGVRPVHAAAARAWCTTAPAAAGRNG